MTFNPQRGTRTSSNENLNQEIKNPFELAKIPEIESSKYKNSKSNDKTTPKDTDKDEKSNDSKVVSLEEQLKLAGLASSRSRGL